MAWCPALGRLTAAESTAAAAQSTASAAQSTASAAGSTLASYMAEGEDALDESQVLSIIGVVGYLSRAEAEETYLSQDAAARRFATSDTTDQLVSAAMQTDNRRSSR